MAQQIGQETIANGLGSPTAQATGSTSYNENASPRELYNQLWEMRRQQAEAAKAESVEQRRERVRSNFLATAQEIQDQQRNRGSTSAESTTPTPAANETSTTQAPKTVQEQNLEYLEQVRRESLNPFTRLLNAVSSGAKNYAAQLASTGANLAEIVAKSAPL
jgi:DNA anti-recombination protein RmuC